MFCRNYIDLKCAEAYNFIQIFKKFSIDGNSHLHSFRACYWHNHLYDLMKMDEDDQTFEILYCERTHFSTKTIHPIFYFLNSNKLYYTVIK